MRSSRSTWSTATSSPTTSPTPRSSCGTRSRPDRTCCSRGRRDVARHRPRHVPVRHLVEPDGGRRRGGHRYRPEDDRLRDRGREGVHLPRRDRPVPHGAPRRDGRPAHRHRRRVRRGHRPPAPVWVARCGCPPLRRAGERPDRDRPHQAGHPVALRDDQDRHRVHLPG